MVAKASSVLSIQGKNTEKFKGSKGLWEQKQNELIDDGVLHVDPPSLRGKDAVDLYYYYKSIAETLTDSGKVKQGKELDDIAEIFKRNNSDLDYTSNRKGTLPELLGSEPSSISLLSDKAQEISKVVKNPSIIGTSKISKEDESSILSESEIKPTGKGGLNRNIGDKSNISDVSKSHTTSKSSSSKSGEFLESTPSKSTNTTKEILEPTSVKSSSKTEPSKKSDITILEPSASAPTSKTSNDIIPNSILEEPTSKQEIDSPNISSKIIPNAILFDLLIKPVAVDARPSDSSSIFISNSPSTQDDILTPTPSKSPIPKGAIILRDERTNKRGLTTRKQRREFLGNTRQDSILGVYDRTEIIHGDKKVRRTERKDAKIIRGLRRRADREILPSVKSKDDFLSSKSKDEDIDFLGGRKSETNTPKRGKPQKEILPSVKSKDNSFLDGEKSEKGKKSKDEDIDFLGGAKSEKGKKSKFDGWF